MTADAPTFDLQSHSQHSDGALTPSQVVVAAADAGVELLALTDHDTVDGLQEAGQAAQDAGVRLVTGVEISALDVGTRDLHILGYLIDARDPVLRQQLEDYRGARKRRAVVMAQAISELGFELDQRALQDRIAAGKSIGRPQLPKPSWVIRQTRSAWRTRAVPIRRHSSRRT